MERPGDRHVDGSPGQRACGATESDAVCNAPQKPGRGGGKADLIVGVPTEYARGRWFNLQNALDRRAVHRLVETNTQGLINRHIGGVDGRKKANKAWSGHRTAYTLVSG